MEKTSGDAETGEKILVVDDDLSIRDTLKDLLEEHRYAVRTTASASGAAEIVQAQSIDVALIDINLPDGSGRVLLHDFKQHDPEMICIFITGDATLDSAVRAIEEGADGYFVKPFSPSEIAFQIAGKIERRSLRRELRATNERLANLLRASPAVIYTRSVADPAGVAYLSENVLRLLGLPAKCFLADPGLFASLVHPEDKRNAMETDAGANPGDQLTREYRLRHANGSYRWVRDSALVTGDEKHAPVELVGSLIDITDQKKVEEQVGKVRQEYEHFMRHELRTLLAPIQGFTEVLLKKARGNEEIESIANRLLSSASRAVNLIDRLKTLHMIELGNVALSKRPGSVASLLRSQIHQYEQNDQDSRVKLVLVEEAEKSTVRMDYDLLPGVFQNLIKNAIEHVSELDDPDERTVTVRLFDSDGAVAVSVHNLGEPIAPERLETFFDKFNTDRRTKRGGSGLGTTYAYLVTKAHGGDCSVESNAISGTTITVRLPL